MKNQQLQKRLNEEIKVFIQDSQTLQLATTDQQGCPHASYAPYAITEEGFYILVSEIAQHGKNLVSHSNNCSVLIIEDEEKAAAIYARKRLTYQVEVHPIARNSDDWLIAIECLSNRHGDLVKQLATLSDFHLFLLKPVSGRFVKGFAQAYELKGDNYMEATIDRLKDGHGHRENVA